MGRKVTRALATQSGPATPRHHRHHPDRQHRRQHRPPPSLRAILAASTITVRQRSLFPPFISKRSFDQDRLGTSIGKALNKKIVYLCRQPHRVRPSLHPCRYVVRNEEGHRKTPSDCLTIALLLRLETHRDADSFAKTGSGLQEETDVAAAETEQLAEGTNFVCDAFMRKRIIYVLRKRSIMIMVKQGLAAVAGTHAPSLPLRTRRQAGSAVRNVEGQSSPARRRGAR